LTSEAKAGGALSGTVPDGTKTIYLSVSPGKTIQLFSGKIFNRATVQGTKLYRISNRIRKANFGALFLFLQRKPLELLLPMWLIMKPKAL
jgi:peptidyl-prolyl cis-trans isomerase A (cyclophilin A)